MCPEKIPFKKQLLLSSTLVLHYTDYHSSLNGACHCVPISTDVFQPYNNASAILYRRKIPASSSPDQTPHNNPEKLSCIAGLVCCALDISHSSC